MNKPKDMFLRLFIFLHVWISVQSETCSLTKIRILDNFYTKEILEKFPDSSITAVSFNRAGRIQYAINDKLYEYDFSKNQSEEIVGQIIENDEKKMFVNGKFIMALKNKIEEKQTATVNFESDEKFTLTMQDEVMLVIKLPMGDNTKPASGKMYALNETDVVVVGNFVMAELIRELGDHVIDASIDSITGDIAIAIQYNKGSALVHLQKFNEDPCPKSSCQEKSNLMRTLVREKLFGFEGAIMSKLLDMPKCKNDETAIRELITSIDMLTKRLKRLQSFSKEYKDYSRESIQNINLNVSMSKRDIPDDSRLVCTSKKNYTSQHTILNQVLYVLDHMGKVLDFMDSSNQTNFPQNQSLIELDDGTFKMSDNNVTEQRDLILNRDDNFYRLHADTDTVNVPDTNSNLETTENVYTQMTLQEKVTYAFGKATGNDHFLKDCLQKARQIVADLHISSELHQQCLRDSIEHKRKVDERRWKNNN